MARLYELQKPRCEPNHLRIAWPASADLGYSTPFDIKPGKMAVNLKHFLLFGGLTVYMGKEKEETVGRNCSAILHYTNFQYHAAKYNN